MSLPVSGARHGSQAPGGRWRKALVEEWTRNAAWRGSPTYSQSLSPVSTPVHSFRPRGEGRRVSPLLVLIQEIC